MGLRSPDHPCGVAVKELSGDYKTAFDTARCDALEGWYDPALWTREDLTTHLESRHNYSAEFIRGYCDGAFSITHSKGVAV